MTCCGAPLTGMSEAVGCGVGLHLQAGGVDGEGVDGAFLDLLVEAEAEAVGEQVLVHGVEVVEVAGLVGLGFDVEARGGEPVGATLDLAHGDLIHEADHELYGDVSGGVALSAGHGLNEAVFGVGVGGVDYGYVEGEAWRWGLRAGASRR